MVDLGGQSVLSLSRTRARMLGMRAFSDMLVFVVALGFGRRCGPRSSGR